MSRGNTPDCSARSSGFDSRLWQGFSCLLFVSLLLRFYFFVQNTLFAMKLCNSLYLVYLILHNL